MGFKHFNFTIATIIFVTTINSICGQFFNRKPWPTYSLHNMPRTSFSCHDKILGGYYADSETQCQMFHVCVKVAGVGVQDFRFLCPNGTAFDQEAQICADWGDVDCEQATLYYSSDNFDLYRIGSGFENKRAPLAEEEEEATFHLQRAETNDVRRSKQTIINQSVRPEQPPIYHENTERNYVQQQPSYNDQYQYQQKKSKEAAIQKPITTKKPYYQKQNNDNQYSNTGRNNDYQSDLRNEDELLKGSHSSNFFNNRNNGKEDDLVEFTKAPVSTKRPVYRGRQRARNPSRQNYDAGNQNNIPTPPTKTTTTFTYQEPKINEQQQKPKPTVKNNSKTLTLQTSFRTAELHQYDTQYNFKNSTVAPPTVTTTTTQRYNLTPTKPQTQQHIQPTTYNPSYNPFRVKSTTNFDDYRTPKPNSFSSTQPQNNGNPFYNVQYEKAAESKSDQYNQFSNTNSNYNNNKQNTNDHSINNDFNKFQTTTQNYNNFSQKNSKNLGKYDLNGDNKQSHSLGEPLGRRNDDQFFQQTSSKNTNQNQQNYDNNNNHQVSNTNNDLSLTVRPLEARRVNAALTNQTNNSNTAPIQNSNQQQFYELQTNTRAFPTPFAKATPSLNNFQQPHYSSPIPRGFSYETTKPSSSSLSAGSTQQATNNRYQKISRNNENYTPSTTTKKFSTLVPKDQYYPTTFKPATYKKAINGYNQKNDKPTNFNFAGASYLPTTSTSTSFPPSQTEPDEDDGQYHPELYEKDFPRNKIQKKSQKPRVTNSFQTTRHFQTPSPPVDFGDEDEFLKPAHSQNIAVGANQLRAEKVKQQQKEQQQLQQQQQQQQQQSSLNPSSHKSSASTTRITHITTTARPTPPPIPASKQKSSKSKSKSRPKANEDTSYDYAYYDTGSENPHDYAEYDVISEFGKTRKNQ